MGIPYIWLIAGLSKPFHAVAQSLPQSWGFPRNRERATLKSPVEDFDRDEMF